MYIAYDPSQLLPFVKVSNFLAFENVYRSCKNHDPPLWEIMIYALARMGKHKEALDLILIQLGNMEQAIAFVEVSFKKYFDL